MERVPNIPSKYYWIDTDTVRYFPIAIYKVESHDDQYLYIKQYIVDQQPATVAEKKSPPRPPIDIPASHLFALQDFGSGLPQTGQWRDDFAIADMNGDGHLDIVFGPARKSFSIPFIYLGDGQGHWQRWHDTKFPSLPFDYGAAAVADFNGDGIPDIALGMHLRGLTVLTGDGKGHFAQYDQNLPMGTPGSKQPATFSSISIQAVDWNGDGKMDLVALSEGLLGASKGSPAGLTTFLNTNGSWAQADVPAMEKDVRAGALTRVAADSAQKPKLIAITGASGESATVYASAADHWDAHKVDAMPKGAVVRAIAAAELDGKGAVALVVSYQIVVDGAWHSAIDVFYPTHDAYIRRALHDEVSQLSMGALALGHLSSRATWDLVALRGDGTMMIFAADGRGFFTRDLQTPPPEWRAGCAGTSVHLRDLDGDGIDEIVASFAGENNPAMLKHECMQGGGIAAWKIAKPN